MRATWLATAISVAASACSISPIAFRPEDTPDVSVDPSGCPAAACATSLGCATAHLDRIIRGTTSGADWFGGDDRPGSTRSVGFGQGVLPLFPITMRRFGFLLVGGLRFSTTGSFGTQPNTLQLDLRDANGVVLATYSTVLPPDARDGWVYWDTPATKLAADQLYVFTASLATAFEQKVNGGVAVDAVDYAGGAGYAAEVSSGDLSSWSVWSAHEFGYAIRIQERNLFCMDSP